MVSLVEHVVTGSDVVVKEGSVHVHLGESRLPDRKRLLEEEESKLIMPHVEQDASYGAIADCTVRVGRGLALQLVSNQLCLAIAGESQLFKSRAFIDASEGNEKKEQNFLWNTVDVFNILRNLLLLLLPLLLSSLLDVPLPFLRRSVMVGRQVYPCIAGLQVGVHRRLVPRTVVMNQRSLHERADGMRSRRSEVLLADQARDADVHRTLPVLQLRGGLIEALSMLALMCVGVRGG
mmetsp:Transcript_10620/g.35533  ORF Transcript_10620/g.35533 Transcript_10620/m.35533 type:complete len:235 (+) Transcript_10620:609-1313(+)